MAARTAPPPPLPVRGTPGGYRDRWDGPDEAAVARAEMDAVEGRVLARAAAIGAALRAEDAASSSAIAETARTGR